MSLNECVYYHFADLMIAIIQRQNAEINSEFTSKKAEECLRIQQDTA
jgi:hypothetical protein